MAIVDIWVYRDQSWGTADLAGFEVEAVDGSIGKLDESTYEVGQSYLVVDTGPWIFGKKVLLPVGVIDRIDFAEKTIYVTRTKDDIKHGPEFDEMRFRDDQQYRDEFTDYYGKTTAGMRR